MIVSELRIVGSTQTNVVMAAELVRVAQRAIGRRPPAPRKDGLGQLVMPFDPELAWAAVTYMRTPTRVLWDVFRCRADRLEPLYEELLTDVVADPRALWRDGDGISVETRRVDAFAAGERQIVGTVKNALVDGAGRRGMRLHVDPERPATRWLVRQDDRGELIVSIDLGEGSLSQRGWRRSSGLAPLREHLAAVLLMLCRFDPRADVLIDPMCGSGTIPIEAALLARAPPRRRATLDRLGLGAGQTAAPLFADAETIAIGCDIDLQVLAAARQNARDAHSGGLLTWQRADVRQLGPELVDQILREHGKVRSHGLLISNPPYGERLDADLELTYAALAALCRRFAGRDASRSWRAGFLVGTPVFEEVFGQVLGRPRIKKPLANANLRGYFLLYDL